VARGADEFIVREHFADESARVVVVVDRRPSLALGPPPAIRLDKRAAGSCAITLIQTSALAARSMVGYLAYDAASPVWDPPRSGHQPRVDLEGFAAPADALSLKLAFLDRQRADLPAGSFVFVVSDFLCPWVRREWARALARGWDIIPVVVQDPVWESDFPDVADVTMRLREAGSVHAFSVRLTRHDVAARRAANGERFARLLGFFREFGLDPVVISSAEPAEVAAAFFRWADERIYVRGGR
jgi:uncharacterized protein (DUF58 family)